MTFKKINKSCKRGQSIFEYFILTIAVVAIVFAFRSSTNYEDISVACENAFVNAVGRIVQ